MLKHLLRTLLVFCAVVSLAACSSDSDAPESQAQTTLQLEFKLTPDNIQVKEYKHLKISFKELNSGFSTSRELTNTNVLKTVLPTGTYTISVEGSIVYSDDSGTIEGKVGGLQTGVVVNGNEQTKTVAISLKAGSGDLILEEVFFTGTKTPQGAMYFGDQYFKITNNTDQILYADGMLLIQSSFMTNEKQDYSPNIMTTTFSAGAIIKIPGTGQTYPVKPGESIIIAEDAINHKEFNPSSINLSQADFQIFKEDSDDIDNPLVPKMMNVFEKMVIHTQGYYAYALARMPQGMTNEALISQNTYTYTYNLTFGGDVYPMDGTAVKIPNEWITDAVNLSVQDSFQWLVTSPSLDMGWTSVASFDGDKNRFGKAVRRKVIGKTAEGKNILKDTHNSTVDFEHGVKPSLFN
ncbi:DUF4876 domain-containing protein [Chryseobacterium indologenes]|uniref:DUF4876 domain-containing protein n=1 Tax=Chryseobacterium indologenes TaxID=253 RepID=UPI000F4FFB12|nr:DUF4876 domain-containing protein [Chryseobacterium indologenes]AYZ36028.1 DUF4876 domain-containing protein [Chryseobacterium indologenes]MBF6644815.1 DUF4876 domain-containing protein [Chryseobacterium indologenes]MBU3047587.1 DUF4876 domain-containing protein [Chryseobacterium indologenes]MEB4760649.1 DUF4876 domain-containing protein [Chryseobacterium indologenes]QQQ71494.1 DUF4876 domain-containing protein [Chryseobacterium indologenes]